MHCYSLNMLNRYGQSKENRPFSLSYLLLFHPTSSFIPSLPSPLPFLPTFSLDEHTMFYEKDLSKTGPS